MSARQAAFIGVGAMVGAGIFSLLGAAGEVAGSAVWISFVIAGIVAGLQGYSFARMGARFPSAGGLLEYVARGYGNGHVTGVIGWLLLAVNAIITAMVAVSFGSYAGEIFADGSAGWTKFFAVVLVLAMTMLNILGSEAVAKAQTVVVVVVIGILGIFAVTTLSTIDLDLLAFSGYPPAQGHRRERRADVLRLPRVRRHHIHREGPGQPGAGAAPRRLPRAHHRDGDLRGRIPGRLRRAHRRRGH